MHKSRYPCPGPPRMSAVFKVEDMSCGHCVSTIRAALQEAMPGVPVQIDLERHLVTVDGDAGLAATTMREAGYEPVPSA